MRSVAYVRVSTLKEEQALSLQNQHEYFKNYIVSRGDELVHIYSDHGKSATKMQNRKELQKMIKDAKQGKFDKIYVKDISRIFRNTLDFITFTRDLMDKHNIKLHLVNFGEGKDMDPFTLNLMAMIAEHESKKISERIKFGKEFSKKKGIVPNFVFGYTRIDKYTLEPHPTEADWIKKIFDLYTESGWGMARIAKYLFENRVITKKSKDNAPNYNWSQHVIGTILKNQIYVGRVINGKQSTTDLYSTKRKDNDEEDWYVTERPEFRLVSDEQFFKAQDLIEKNRVLFPSTPTGQRDGARRSEAHLFSNMLKCNCCGFSYRRYQKKYSENGQLYVWWTCSKRAAYGSGRCSSEHIKVDEASVANALSELFSYLIADRDNFFDLIQKKCNTIISEYIHINSKIDLTTIQSELNELQAERNRMKSMMIKGLLDIDEGEADMKVLNKEIERLSNILNKEDVTAELTTRVKENLKEFFKTFSVFSFTEGLDNVGLKRIVKEIRVISKTELQVVFNVDDDIKGLSFPITLSESVPQKVGQKANDTTDTDWDINT